MNLMKIASASLKIYWSAMDKFRILVAFTFIFLVLIVVNIQPDYFYHISSQDYFNVSDCLGLCYQEFNLDNVSKVISDGSYSTFMAKSSSITCRFHAVQLAVFTCESPSTLLYGIYKVPGTLILQMRHDGLIGLPGGGVRNGESLIRALNREIEEELGIGLDSYKNYIEYLISYSDQKRNYCGHLFGLKLPWAEIKLIVAKAMRIPDLGLENLGYFLMPTVNEIKDGAGFDGLPSFLAQSLSPYSPPKMVGNTLQQIFYVLTSATNPPILSKETMAVTLKLVRKLLSISSQLHEKPNSYLGGTHLDHFFE